MVGQVERAALAEAEAVAVLRMAMGAAEAVAQVVMAPHQRLAAH